MSHTYVPPPAIFLILTVIGIGCVVAALLAPDTPNERKPLRRRPGIKAVVVWAFRRSAGRLAVLFSLGAVFATEFARTWWARVVPTRGLVPPWVYSPSPSWRDFPVAICVAAVGVLAATRIYRSRRVSGARA